MAKRQAKKNTKAAPVIKEPPKKQAVSNEPAAPARCPKDTSKVEAIAHKKVIEDLVSKGWNYKMIYNHLHEQNKVSTKYHAFVRAIKVYCELEKAAYKIPSHTVSVENNMPQVPNMLPVNHETKPRVMPTNKPSEFLCHGNFIGDNER